MSLLSKFTVTPLLYACGGLLLVVIGLSIALYVQSGKVDTAQAEQATAEAQRDTAITERDAWKVRVDELAAANGAYTNALGVVRTELGKCQEDNRTVAAQGQRATAAARAEAADADATLKAFTAQFQTTSRSGQCGAALAAMQSACPTLEGY